MRKKFGGVSYEEFFKQVPKDEAEYYLRTQGSTAGVILDGFDYKPTTGRFMVGSKDRILEYNWRKIARFASGAPSIGLHDIAWGFRSPDIEQLPGSMESCQTLSVVITITRPPRCSK